jgi:hypothetical protein
VASKAYLEVISDGADTFELAKLTLLHSVRIPRQRSEIRAFLSTSSVRARSNQNQALRIGSCDYPVQIGTCAPP